MIKLFRKKTKKPKIKSNIHNNINTKEIELINIDKNNNIVIKIDVGKHILYI